jgi:hypothetical protein
MNFSFVGGGGCVSESNWFFSGYKFIHGCCYKSQGFLHLFFILFAFFFFFFFFFLSVKIGVL